MGCYQKKRRKIYRISWYINYHVVNPKVSRQWLPTHGRLFGFLNQSQSCSLGVLVVKCFFSQEEVVACAVSSTAAPLLLWIIHCDLDKDVKLALLLQNRTSLQLWAVVVVFVGSGYLM